MFVRGADSRVGEREDAFSVVNIVTEEGSRRSVRDALGYFTGDEEILPCCRSLSRYPRNAYTSSSSRNNGRQSFILRSFPVI